MHKHGLTHFYFAVPSHHTLAKSTDHIAETFGIDGDPELVRSEPMFALYRIAVPA